MIGKKWKMGLQKCAIGCMIILLMVTSACGSKEAPAVTDEKTAIAMLGQLQSYETNVNITFCSNKGENTYLVNQKVNQDGRYRLEILEPPECAGVLTISDGNQIAQTDPAIGGQIQAKPNAVREALLLYSFIEAYGQGGQCAEEEGNLVLTADYPAEHRKIVKGQLTLAKGSGTPLSLVITDENGKESIHMVYQTWLSNPELGEENFQITVPTE